MPSTSWRCRERAESYTSKKSGLRVLSRRRLKGERVVELCMDDHRLKVLAHVVWSERLCFGQHIVGLEFPTATSEFAHYLMAFTTA